MKDNDYLVFTEYLTGLAEALKGKLSEMKIKIYFEALKDIPLEGFKQAVSNIARTSKFFPVPAEIREAIFGRPEDQAVIAVDKIQGALRGVGGYESVCFDDPIIHLIIQNYGGWAKLSDITQDEWKWLRKEFEKHYKVYAGRGTSYAVIPERLAGIHERVSDTKQLPWPDKNVRLIGDERKILAWTTEKKALAAAKVEAKRLKS